MADHEQAADHDQTATAPLWLVLLIVVSLGAGTAMLVATRMQVFEPWMLGVGVVVSIAVITDLLWRSRRHS